MALLCFFRHFFLVFKEFHEKLMIIDPQLCGVGFTKVPPKLAGPAEGGSKSGLKLFIEVVKCHSNQKNLYLYLQKIAQVNNAFSLNIFVRTQTVVTLKYLLIWRRHIT